MQIKEDDRAIREYYNSLRSHDTPLGIAMKDYTLSVKDLSAKEVKEAILADRKVIIVDLLPDLTHLMHIGYNQNVGFTSISDSDAKVQLFPYAKYPCYIFDRKSEQ